MRARRVAAGPGGGRPIASASIVEAPPVTSGPAIHGLTLDVGRGDHRASSTAGGPAAPSVPSGGLAGVEPVLPDPAQAWPLIRQRAALASDEVPVVERTDDRGAAPTPRRILFVASTGGHLAQLTAMQQEWAGDERVWVTFDKADARSSLRGERVVHAYHPTTRNVPNAMRNLVLGFRVLARERPEVVVSTGAGVALPFFVVARLSGTPSVYLEVVDRVDSRTMTGWFCRALATRFCVQWTEQARLYPGAEVIGRMM